MPDFEIRDATINDAPALARIYGEHVRMGVASFEVDPPDTAAIRVRLAAIQDAGYPWQVAARDGAVAGYCYAGPHKQRRGYRFTVEDSVYVASAHHGRGIGRALLARVIELCRNQGYRQMMAVIGDSGNAGSIHLHEKMGFTLIGIAHDIGFKQGRHIDVVFMQKDLRKP